MKLYKKIMLICIMIAVMGQVSAATNVTISINNSTGTGYPSEVGLDKWNIIITSTSITSIGASAIQTGYTNSSGMAVFNLSDGIYYVGAISYKGGSGISTPNYTGTAVVNDTDAYMLTVPDNTTAEINNFSESGAARGYVKTSSGSGINGAKVYIENLQGTSLPFYTTTWTYGGSAGYYSFFMPNGNYTLEVEKSGYVTKRTNVTVTKGYGSVGSEYYNITLSTPPPTSPPSSGGGGGGGGGISSPILEGVQTLTTSLLTTIYSTLNLNYKQFYEVDDVLAAVFAASVDIYKSGYPAPTDLEVRAKLKKPVKTMEGDIYVLASENVLKRWSFANTVIISRGDLEVDSMAAVFYAKMKGVPILLTEPDKLPPATLDTIKKLKPKGIIIMGGPVAVSKDVEDELNALATVERVGGADRAETAVKMAKKMGVIDTIIIADGQNSDMDAVLLSAEYKAPIVYVYGSEIPDVTKDFLEEHRFVGLGSKTQDFGKATKVITAGIDKKAANEIQKIMNG